ncbi:MAG: hypothetical protein FWF50_02400 [Defluviitaleaceae bacterium]|nr:hypothetical protein [Defluviitaleaceae bacterium]
MNKKETGILGLFFVLLIISFIVPWISLITSLLLISILVFLNLMLIKKKYEHSKTINTIKNKNIEKSDASIVELFIEIAFLIPII